MDRDLRARLDELLEKQESLKRELRSLEQRAASLDGEISKVSWEAKAAALQKAPQQPELSDQPKPVVPPPLPDSAVSPERVPVSAVAKATPEGRRAETGVAAVPPAAVQQQATQGKTFDAGEWELNFGRVWLVRIGVLLLLTGLIFLSTYAYKNWLFHAGAAMKVTFFMTVSLVLTGAGLWLEKWRAGFRQYGRVVASGGLAAGYYTIYAAHFVPTLKLVHSPVLAGVLLTLWAGVMLGYATWKKSRVVAVMAIGLAFYGTIVNPSGWLSLFSALLLSCAGIWLMLRFRWVSVGLGVVAAAYASHAFWLGLYPGEVAGSVGMTYLACYWSLFTVALMVPQARKLPQGVQRWMAALNNAAAWYLAVFSIPALTPHPEIGWISLGVGSAWIGIAALARGGGLWHRSLAVVFGYQGLMIASLGVLIEATGYTRFLVLAVEACILLLGARSFGGTLARGASALVFVVSLVTALPQMNGGVPAHWLSYAAFAAVCAAYAGIVKRDEQLADPMLALFPACVFWTVLGAGVFSQWDAPAAVNGLWLAAAAAVLGWLFLGNIRWLGVLQELAAVSVPAAFIAGWWCLSEHGSLSLGQSAVPLMGAACFWYLSPGLTGLWGGLTGNRDTGQRTALEWVFSVLFWLMAGATANHHMADGSGWMILGGVLALAGHAAAEFFKRRSIGAPALVLHLVALLSLAEHGNTQPLAGWAPALLLAVHLALAGRRWNIFGTDAVTALLSAGLAAAVATHAFQEFDRPDLALAALGLAMAAWSSRRRNTGMMMAGSVFPMLVACLAAVMIHGSRDWLRYLPVLSTLVLHAMLWRQTKEDASWKPSRVMLLSAGLLTLFFSSTWHVNAAFDGSGVAICWALLATLLFCAGLVIRCRPYRLTGLWWLAAAVLHVVCIDVMRLETLGRILSFITLGLVLLVLGFLYNKFQDTIRKFL